MVNCNGHQGLRACSLLIARLEEELAKARALRDDFEVGRLAPSALLPLRHFCAGLVETSVELARQVAELTADTRPAAESQ